jgi:hypothetical protein
MEQVIRNVPRVFSARGVVRFVRFVIEVLDPKTTEDPKRMRYGVWATLRA